MSEEPENINDPKAWKKALKEHIEHLKFKEEAEGHKEFMDNSEILKKMNTEESKEGVKRFFDNTKQNS
jgi:hypothetical protein